MAISPRLSLQLLSVQTANRDRLFANRHLQLISVDKVPRASSSFGDTGVLPGTNLAHVDNNAEIWQLLAETPDGQPLGHLVVEVKNENISAIHCVQGVGGRIEEMEHVVSCVLASTTEPVRIIGVSSGTAEFWSSIGAAPLDLYNNSSIHWSDYERATANEPSFGTTTGTLAAAVYAESVEMGRRQPAAAARTARRRAQSPLKQDELAWLNAYTASSQERTFYQFAGFRSRNANHIALDAAKQFAAKGYAPDDIRKKTGWFRGEDRQLRYEISDHNAEIRLDEFIARDRILSYIGPLQDILHHPTLYAAYPQLARLNVSLMVSPGQELMGQYSHAATGHDTQLDITADSIEEMRYGLLHELQHVIQTFEGFAKGGNYKQLGAQFAEAVNERFNLLSDRLDEIDRMEVLSDLVRRERSIIQTEMESLQNAASAVKKDHMAPMLYERYLNLAGEREAVLTADRGDLTPGQRYSQPPVLETGDINPIIVFNDTKVCELAAALDLPACANITLFPTKSIIRLSTIADRSSFFHEAAHLFLDMEAKQARGREPTDFQKKILTWLNVESFEEIGRQEHEKFAQGFEQYLMKGEAPTPGLRGVFATVKGWLSNVYRNLTDLGEPINSTAKSIYDQLLTSANPDPMNAQQALDAQLKLRNQLISTGLYNLTEANTTAAVVGAYALAKAERDPMMPTVNKVFEQMNIQLEVAEGIDMDEGPVYDFETFSIHALVDEQRYIADENRTQLDQLDLSNLSDTLDLAHDHDLHSNLQVH